MKILSYLTGFFIYSQIRKVTRYLALGISLFLLWYSLFFALGWYSPGLHLFATFSSALLISTGNSWGLVGKLVN